MPSGSHRLPAQSMRGGEAMTPCKRGVSDLGCGRGHGRRPVKSRGRSRHGHLAGGGDDPRRPWAVGSTRRPGIAPRECTVHGGRRMPLVGPNESWRLGRRCPDTKRRLCLTESLTVAPTWYLTIWLRATPRHPRLAMECRSLNGAPTTATSVACDSCSPKANP